MDVNFDKDIKEWLVKNLHFVRSKLFDLSDYELKTESEKKLAEQKNAYEKELEKIKTESANAINELKADYDGEISALKEKYNGELTAAKKEADTTIKGLNEKLSRYEANYAEIEEVYALYNRLDSRQKFSLAGYFGTASNPKEFFSGVAQEKNLKDLWEYVSRSIISGRTEDEDIRVYKRIFDFAFDTVNLSARSPLYIRLNANIGDDFDPDTMATLPGGNKIGEVENVLFQGFLYGESKKVIAKSLVVLD